MEKYSQKVVDSESLDILIVIILFYSDEVLRQVEANYSNCACIIWTKKPSTVNI